MGSLLLSCDVGVQRLCAALASRRLSRTASNCKTHETWVMLLGRSWDGPCFIAYISQHCFRIVPHQNVQYRKILDKVERCHHVITE